MKTILTSALVISGLMGSAQAEPVLMDRTSNLFDISRQELAQPSSGKGLGDSLMGVTGFTVNLAKQPEKLARSSSFDKLKEAKPFMNQPKADVVVKPSLLQRAWTWIKSFFGC
ncbi:MAG: hypothetical protein KF798_04590 [Candidatus Paracaedibacteraceae bacterium]|nr:hypothetical protein [Candidatus Paracaedibacteraceae bacterium]